jgi:hypothetical protein
MPALPPIGVAVPPTMPAPPVPVLVPLDRVTAIEHMLDVCGLTLAQRNTVMNIEGIQDIDALANIYLRDVKQMTENLSCLQVNRGGAYFGTSVTAKVKALIWWVQDAQMQGNVIDPNDWDAAILDDARKRMLLEKQGRDKVDDIVDASKKLDPSKWVDSYPAFINFLHAQTSANGKRMLHYVVRKDPPVGWTRTSREDRLNFYAPLMGPFYAQDNQKVHRVTTKQWTLNSATFAWIRLFDKVEDGCGAITAMHEHYDGPDKMDKKLGKAEAELNTIHYHNEQSMTFKSYVNKLNDIFFVFAEANQPLTLDQKVNTRATR